MRRLVAVIDGPCPAEPPTAVKVGVDLGTASTVLVVVDEDDEPLACAIEAADVVRDGVVVDFAEAVNVVRRLKAKVEQQLGVGLTAAMGAYPPGVAQSEVRAVRHVIEGADMDCVGLVDEPSAANAVLEVSDAAIVDIGGGTTGVAVFEHGEQVHVADEPTGGVHFSLVIAGGLGVPYDEAEVMKRDPSQQKRLFGLVRPVMEKVAHIVASNLGDRPVRDVYLVGGSVSFPGMDEVVSQVTGLKAVVPPEPLLVTPLGIAMSGPALPTGHHVPAYT
jgi:ethanolamine utilization protein EutJ